MSESNPGFESDAAAEPGYSPAIMNRLLSGEALILLASIVIFWPALHGGFIFDDDLLLTDNPLVRSDDGLSRIWFGTESRDYWPVTYSMFWFEWRLWGMNPVGYHGINLLLHVAAALLIWAVLQEMSIPGAFLAALLFTVHPVNVESVAWISQRKGLLALVFCLLSILWWLKADEEKRGKEDEEIGGAAREGGIWYWLSLLAFVLAMLSKGSVAVLPIVLLLIAWWRHRRIGVSDLIRTAPFFAMAALLTVVNVWFQRHGLNVTVRDVGIGERLAGAGAVIWFYLATALAPVHLVFIYPQWHIDGRELLWWLPGLGVAAATIALWRQCRSRAARWVREVLFAWLFFCVSLVPILGFTDVGFMRYSLVADHYQHLALIGVVAMAAAAWSVWRDRADDAGWTANITAAVVVGVLALLAWRQASIYKNPITLYQDTLNKNPTCVVAHFNLANTLAGAGQLDAAVEHYQEALRMKPDYVDAHNNFGSTLVRQGHIPEAIEHYRQALQIQPDNALADTNMGIALLAAGRTPEALEYLEQAVRLADEYSEAHFQLGIALARSGRLSEAVKQFEYAVKLQSYNLNLYANLTSACVELKRPEEAIFSAQRGLELARAQGNTALVQQIEEWLRSYRAEQTQARSAAPPAHAPLRPD